MKTRILVSLLVAALATGHGTVNADEFVVAQKNKAFSITELTVRIGDVVSFLNNDPFFHNIFSLSDAATFDLGSYPDGESRAFTFDEAGVVEIECAIHPRMKMKITVTE